MMGEYKFAIFIVCLGYVTNVLEDAQVYSEHAQKRELDISDVKLAVQTKMDHSFTTPPPRDVCMDGCCDSVGICYTGFT